MHLSHSLSGPPHQFVPIVTQTSTVIAVHLNRSYKKHGTHQGIPLSLPTMSYAIIFAPFLLPTQFRHPSQCTSSLLNFQSTPHHPHIIHTNHFPPHKFSTSLSNSCQPWSQLTGFPFIYLMTPHSTTTPSSRSPFPPRRRQHITSATTPSPQSPCSITPPHPFHTTSITYTFNLPTPLHTFSTHSSLHAGSTPTKRYFSSLTTHRYSILRSSPQLPQHLYANFHCHSLAPTSLLLRPHIST